MSDDALLAEYREVCNNFRLLTDIRFRLLAFLPVATAAGLALKGTGAGERFALSLFGLAATAGLIIYNTRNNQLYRELLERAAAIEHKLGLPDGAFAARSRPWVSVNFLGRAWMIDHAAGVGLIYQASIALWLFGLFSAALQAVGFASHGTNLVALGLACVVTVWAANDIGQQIKAQRDPHQAPSEPDRRMT